MNQSREISLTRGLRRYVIKSQREVANDRFIGSIDGRPVATAGHPCGCKTSTTFAKRRGIQPSGRWRRHG